MAVLLSAVSCSVTKYVSREPSMKAEWTGRTHADIVRNFGAPTREVSDGADGLILVYESFYTTHESEKFGSELTTTSEEHRNFKEFSLGTDGICYDVRTNEMMEDGKEKSLGTTLLVSAGAAVAGVFITMWIVTGVRDRRPLFERGW